jgi:flagellar hook-length control protein FliK
MTGAETRAAGGTRSNSSIPPVNTDASGAVVAADSPPVAQAQDMAAMAAALSGAAGSDVSVAAADSTLTAADAGSAPVLAGKASDGAVANAPSLPAVAAAASRQAAVAATTVSAASTSDAAGATGKHARDATGDALRSDGSGDGAAVLAQVSSGAAVIADSAPTVAGKVSAGVDTPEFGQGVADRVSWMVDNNLNGAKLQVNPAQLGPIEVRIAVQGGHAQVWMTSHSAVTRDALESSTPKLREMLNAQGFGQVSVDISQRSFQERSPQAQSYDWTPSGDGAGRAAAVSGTGAAATNSRVSTGVLDAYA